MTKEIKETMRKEMNSRILLCKKQGIDVTLTIVTGLPSDEILKVIKNQKIDLIVMAKRRKLKGFKSFLTLGNISRKIVENTSCPILMIDTEKKK